MLNALGALLAALDDGIHLSVGQRHGLAEQGHHLPGQLIQVVGQVTVPACSNSTMTRTT